MGHNVLLIFNFSLYIDGHFSSSELHPLGMCSSVNGSMFIIISSLLCEKNNNWIFFSSLNSQPIATMNL